MAVFTEPTKWAQTLGKDADVAKIPNTAGETDPSIDKIFPPVFSIPLARGGKAIPRSVLNGLFKLLGDWIYYIQNGGIASYSSAFDYAVGSFVKYNNALYLCVQSNGASSTVKAPTDSAYWSKLLSISDLRGYVTNPVNSDLIFNNALRILRNDNDKYLIFVAGTNSSTSSSITINGINRNDGSIGIQAKDSNSNTNGILINANGTISWNSDNIKTVMANSAMPSDTYTALSVGGSGTTYTAPKNGYFWAYGNSTDPNAFLQLNAQVGMRCFVTITAYLMDVFIPVKKNDVATLFYQNIATANITLKFVEAIGG